SYEELAALAESVVLIEVHNRFGMAVSSGSGIVINDKGYILTNCHVANGGASYLVKIENDNNSYPAYNVIKYHPLLDLAIIRIDKHIKPLSVYNGSAPLNRGQRVVAIGSPLGLFNSVSDGIISGFRTVNGVEMIQFTAPISHGSSGGAVLNMYGEVIGISTAGVRGGQNLNLAVGFRDILPFIDNFI
ncbi:MAG: S1C family serine protease, partial [Oscillospiraceae bacterium]